VRSPLTRSVYFRIGLCIWVVLTILVISFGIRRLRSAAPAPNGTVPQTVPVLSGPMAYRVEGLSIYN
jgi:hypothetical protein